MHRIALVIDEDIIAFMRPGSLPPPPPPPPQPKQRAGSKLPPFEKVVVPVEDPTVRGWIYQGEDRGLVLKSFDRHTPEPGEVVCDIVMSTICGSDLHTIHGRREEPTPLILGHEIVGRVSAIGGPGMRDWQGEVLSVGDLVTWSIMASCGNCFYCKRNLPQKCLNLHKYGHCSCEGKQPLSGGFSESIVLRPGTAIFKIPEHLDPEFVVPANCALATAFNAVDTVDLQAGETVLIQGAGLVGIYLAAICKELGASKVIVVDVNARRLRIAERFRADIAVDLSESTGEALTDLVNAFTYCHGVDVVFEACGSDTVIEPGARLLRKGGRYLVAGLVTADARFDIPADLLTKNCLSVMGIHNYRPEHLARAMAFIDLHADSLPFGEIVGAVYPLSSLREAIKEASTGKHLRVALHCTHSKAKGSS